MSDSNNLCYSCAYAHDSYCSRRWIGTDDTTTPDSDSLVTECAFYIVDTGFLPIEVYEEFDLTEEELSALEELE